MKFLTDEHIAPALVRGLRRVLPEVDILELRLTDPFLKGRPDPEVLDYAAQEGRILVTRDVSTVPDYAYARVQRGEAMPGVFIWRRRASLGEVMEDLLLMVRASDAEEWVDRVVYLPL